jgi:hypothetical protein
MRTRNSRRLPNPRWSLPRASVATIVATCLAVTPAEGAFHLWSIREVYTDACGTNQFIELFTTFGSQTFVGGKQIQVSDGTTTHTYTISGNLTNDSANHALLFGTASITNFGSPPPDYILPDNFVFAGGGTITFFGANGGPYTNLPTDGVNSRTWNAGNAANTPQDYPGTVGFITPPNYPPSIWIANPQNNGLFAAPATVAVGVAASDCDGSVASVKLLTNGVPADTNTAAPFGFSLSGLPAGNYTLRTVAQDNGSLNATSAPIVIRVADRPTLMVSPGISGPLQLQFNSAVGIDYVVERATPLTGFSGIVTNSGTGAAITFDETDSSASQRIYRVRLQ